MNLAIIDGAAACYQHATAPNHTFAIRGRARMANSDSTPTSSVPVEWRVIPGFPDYEVSSDGQIMRVRQDRRGHSVPRQLSTYREQRGGYLKVNLFSVDGRMHGKFVHNLMARAFLGDPPSPAHQTAHNDGVRTHNVIGNLRWATAKENCVDRLAHGTQVCGERQWKSVLTADKVIRIREAFRRGATTSDVMREFGISRPTARRVLLRTSWRHLA